MAKGIKLIALLIASVFYAAAYTATDTTYVDQSQNSGMWFKIDTFRLQAGNANFIEINNYASQSAQVYFDAIKIVKTGSADPRYTTIVDDVDWAYLDTIGDWRGRDTRAPAYYGIGFFMDWRGYYPGLKAARFFPPVHETGTYDVYIWYPGWIGANNAMVVVGYDLPAPQYTLTVAQGSGDGSFAQFEYVSISADAPAGGMGFSHWTSDNGGSFKDSTDASTQFTMPGNACTIHAVYSALRTLTVANGLGSGAYAAGSKVAITANNPSIGADFRVWRSSQGGVFADSTRQVTEFTMPDNDVTVTAQYNTTQFIVTEQAHEVPVSHEVDIVVVGGNLGGVAAAITAANAGATVLLTTSSSSFCSELSETYRFWLGPNEVPQAGIAQAIFGTRTSNITSFAFVQPGTYKKNIEQQLVAAGVEFLYWANGIGMLRDGSGDPAGVLIAHKGGVSAVKAKIVIDATNMAGVARMAGAQFSSWAAGPWAVKRYALSTQQDALSTMIVSNSATGSYLKEYPLQVPFSDVAWNGRMIAEQDIRSEYAFSYPFGPDADWIGARAYFTEPVNMVGAAYANGAWTGADNVDINCFIPSGIQRMYVVSGASSISRSNADSLTRPLQLIIAGTRIGTRAASEAAGMGMPSGVVAEAATNGQEYNASYAAVLPYQGLRPNQPISGTVNQSANNLPVWGSFDVVVVGGGPAGSSAAIAATRAGAKVLLIEASGWLGGTGTNGIGSYFAGLKRGFNTEFGKVSWKAIDKAEWLYRKVHDAGGSVWFNTLGCGVVKQGASVTGVIVATPLGCGAVIAKRVIDATGDGDICAAAGAQVMYVNNGDLAIQEASFLGQDAVPAAGGGANEFNSIIVDMADPVGVSAFYYLSRLYGTNRNRFDFFPLIGVRETRKIVGDYTVTILDQYRQRTYSDLVSVANSSYDPHGYEDGPYITAGLTSANDVYMPYRALLPKGLDNILVAGRCASTDHDGNARNRMQADMENQGYAAGYCAAKSVLDNVALRSVNISQVQTHLNSIGNLTSTDMSRRTNSADPTHAQLVTAAADPSVKTNLGMLMAAPDSALPILRAEFSSTPTKAKAFALCLMGDATGVEYLSNWLAGQALGTGKAYSWNAFQSGPGEIDAAIYALGVPRDPRAVAVLSAMLDSCDVTNTDFSHARAITQALRKIADPAGAAALARFLAKPGISGHVLEFTDANAQTVGNMALSFTELFAAGALYACGDVSSTGETILHDYLNNDWRGMLVRYAGHILGLDSSTAGMIRTTATEQWEATLGAHPNPFNPAVTFTLRNLKTNKIPEVRVYDVAGRMIANVSGLQRLPIGKDHCRNYTVQWDGKDAHGKTAATGMYVVQARADGKVLQKKITLIK